LHCDGADASTSFPDFSGKSHTVTPTGAAQVSTAQSVFGGASAKFSSSSSDNLKLDGSSDFSFGTGDFTIEQWVSFDTLADYTVADWAPGPQIRIKSDGHAVYAIGGVDRITSAAALSVNTPYHIAVTRVGGITQLFIGGVAEATAYVASDIITAGANRPVFGGQFVYAGPGDIVSGATRWCGLRAYRLSTVGSNAIRLRRDSDQVEQDIVTVSGGGLDLVSITTFKGSANLFITTYYDQVGTNHEVQATASKQAQLILSGLGSLPIAVYNSAAITGYVTSNVITQAQPFTISAVARRTSNFTTTQVLWANSNSNSLQLSYPAASNLVQVYAGTAATTAPAADNAYHAIQAVFNGASSDLNVDGAVNTINPGTQGEIGYASYMGSFDNLTYSMDGNILELGEWPIAFTPTQSANMSANQHGFWG
jgi:hypothetical protein